MGTLRRAPEADEAGVGLKGVQEAGLLEDGDEELHELLRPLAPLAGVGLDGDLEAGAEIPGPLGQALAVGVALIPPVGDAPRPDLFLPLLQEPLARLGGRPGAVALLKPSLPVLPATASTARSGSAW